MTGNRLLNKTVVIIGASGGIGQAAAQAAAEEGARLMLGSRTEAGLTELRDQLARTGAEVACRTVDVTDEQDVQSFFDEAANLYGRLDMLVNLAGLSLPAVVANMTEEQFDLSMDVNLKGTFLCCKHFIPKTDAEHGGQIVNMGSMAAKRANPNAPLYCTAKAAVNMFSQGLALQLIEKKIRVTSLNPGATDTGFWGTRQVPRDKFMTGADVAEAVMFVLLLNPRVVVHELNFESFAFFK